MKILQLVTRNERRGAEVFAATLSEALAARGHTVLLPALYRSQTPAFALPAVEHLELGGRRQGKFELRPLRGLASAVRTFQPDIVQANGFHALKYAVVAKRLTGARWPIVYRNISVAGDWVPGALRRRWGTWLFRQVQYATSVSELCADDLCRTYGFPRERMAVLRRGIAIAERTAADPARESLRSLLPPASGNAVQQSAAKLLMHIGGFSPEKNQTGLLDAFRIIRDQREDVHLVLCGTGPLLPEVQERARQLGLTAHVTFLGSRPDAAELVGGADLLVLPSHVEGIPGVVLEAAAKGVPSVSTRVGGVAEAVLDGQTGLLVPAREMSQLAAAILSLLADDKRRLAMGRAAYQHVRTHFALDRATDEFELLYQRLTDKA